MDKRKIVNLLLGKFSIKRLLSSFALIYAFILLFVYLFSDRMIFLPRPSSYNDSDEILKLETQDQVYISALYLQNTDADFTILYSHGNAEDLGDLHEFLKEFSNRGFSVFAYDYQGYGTSQGKPSEKNAYRDIEAAYKYMTDQLEIPASRIIALGRSVGAGAAVHLVCRHELAGVILESSFTSAFRAVMRFRLVPFDKFNNIDKIKNLNCPVLVIHGKTDRIIPIHHGQRLFEEANEPKFNFWVDGAGHNDLAWVAGDSYWHALKQFTNTLTK
jgi:fermentation-respiration switch protein FrsA (DUF1100 family)